MKHYLVRKVDQKAAWRSLIEMRAKYLGLRYTPFMGDRGVYPDLFEWVTNCKRCSLKIYYQSAIEQPSIDTCTYCKKAI